MKYLKLTGISFLIAFFTFFTSCEDETTSIGSVIAPGEVVITVDSLTYALNGKAVKIDNFDSKSGNLMIGNLQVENYGNLSCSFVTRLMPAASLGVADSIMNLPDFLERVDSCKLIMGAQRAGIIGDSLAPQKLSVYKLTEQLPADINNTFNPEGYYNPADPFATKSYTVSQISQKDSSFYKTKYVELNIDLPVEFGREIFKNYKENPGIFEWPQTMAKEFLPGLYFKPTFGNGCVANITTIYVGVFYHTFVEETKVEDEETITTVKKASNLSIPFTVGPEVLSSNNITYLPSQNIIEQNEGANQGEVVVTTPGGYIAEFDFPAQDLIDRYRSQHMHLSTVNDLSLYLPAESFDPASGMGIAENILLIKASEYENFFSDNKVPDNLISFVGAYNKNDGLYYFTTMRKYFLELLDKEEITEEDVKFYLVPVEVTTENSNNYYQETTYVTKCVPFTSKPTMTLLKTNEAKIAFSFSTQLID